MDSGDLLAKGLDETESRIKLWLDVAAMVVTGSDGIGKEGRIGRKCDSGRGESAGQNSRRSLERGRGRGRGRGGTQDEVEATGEGLRGHLGIRALGIVDGALMGALSKDFSKEVRKFC